MFNVYVPDPIYERLPGIYLLLAAGLVVVPLSQVKWIAVAALLLAMMITLHQRQTYRETLRLREALNVKQNLEYEPTFPLGEVRLTRTWRRSEPGTPAKTRDRIQPAHDASAERGREERPDVYRTVRVPNVQRGKGLG